jgi:hypothetical protein
MKRLTLIACCASLSFTSALTAQVVINELMFHTQHAVNTAEPIAEEFIELHNTDTVNAVALTGWKFTNGVNYTFGAVTIPAGGYVIVSADPAAFAIKYPSVTATVVGPWVGRLSNSGERIQLENAALLEIDDVTYYDDGDWAVRRRGPLDSGHRGWIWQNDADGEGSSLELINPVLSNNQGQNWASSTTTEGTPGAANDNAAANIAPFISKVKHSPAVPKSTDPVTIKATLTDELPTGSSATLFHRTSGVFTSTPMTNLGAGNFTASLPAQANGTIVEFFIEATDGANTRTWPAPTDDMGGQEANLLYQVDNGTYSGVFGDYRLVFTTAEATEFSFANFNADSNAQMNATFISLRGSDSDIRYTAGVRRRGNGSRDDEPITIRVNLPGDAAWNGETAMNLNSKYGPLQILGQKLFTTAGLAAPEARPIQLRINGSVQNMPGEPNLGAYVHMEPLNSDFLKKHIPADSSGNMYRKRRPSTDLAFENGDISAYIANGWEKQTNTSDWIWTDLDAMHAAFNDTSNPNYIANLEASINVDQWLRWISIMTILANGETNIANGTDDDYAINGGVTDQRFILLPHDLDTILGLGDSSSISDPTHTIYDMFTDGSTIPVLEDFILHPDILPRYHAQLNDLLLTTFAKNRFDFMVDSVTGSLLSNATRSSIKSFMDQRRAYISGEIQPPLTVTSGLSISNGFPVTSANFVALSGTAAVQNTRSIRINGQAVSFNTSTGQWTFGTSSAETVTLLTQGANWSYLDDGSDQGTAWQASGFDDSSWSSGPAELGYGDGNEQTTVGFIDTDPGTAGDQKNATTYFRSTFNVTDASQVSQLTVRLRYDDGAIVYINGVEALVTANMTSGVLYDDFASADTPSETAYQPFTISPSLLSTGSNSIAVEIHQVSATSSDISFDMEVEATTNSGVGSGTTLNPGINRIKIESLDENNNVLETSFYDVWYDDGDVQTLGGTLASNTTLTTAGGPWQITSNLIVPSGITLTIEPGTTVFFDAGTRITVNGRIIADGTSQEHIRLTRTPGAGNWSGIYFSNTLQENSMSWIDQEFSDAASHSVEITSSRLTLDHVQWRGTTETVIETSHPQLIIKNCDFPSSSGSEVIHGANLDGSDFFILDGNVFQTSSGYNDIIDFTGGRRPGPIIYVLNNLFTGGTDDCLDLDGIDAHIEGNTFRNIHTDDPNRPSTSNAIATDGNAHMTIVRNIFDNVDHALLLKNDADAIFENNTVIGATLGAINFNEPLRTVAAGSHVVVEGNIFLNNTFTFRFPNHISAETGLPPVITANRNVMPAAEHTYGTGNIDVDPLLSANFTLLPGSGAIGSGINGADMGAAILQGAIVSGEPPLNTPLDSATLIVHMAGISGINSGSFTPEYRWRLDGTGAWSADTDTAVAITLTGLADGPHFVEVVAKDSTGTWQPDANATQSLTWNVLSTYAAIRINEILANSSTGTDMIELHNAGGVDVDIAGMKISDDPLTPKYIFPAGSNIPAGGNFLFSAETVNGFALSADGDGVYLFDGVNTIVDSITFGLQIQDLTLGRTGHDGNTWTLCTPTLGAANIAQPQGDATRVFINEWLSSGDVFHADDFIELYVASSQPVNVSGFHMSDSPDAEPARYTFPPYSYLAGSSFKVMVADNDTLLGANHLNFKLDANVEWIALYDSALTLLDIVAFTNQQPDVAQGRLPDGGSTIVSFALPTSGLSNVQTTPPTTVSTTLVDWGHTWSYLNDGSDQGTAWHMAGFDNSLWPSGKGILGDENDPLPSPYTIFTTVPLTSGFITYYFRSDFTFTGNPATAALEIETIIDDGAVFYLNGVEFFRQNMPAGAPGYQTQASNSGEASYVGPVSVPATALLNGVNELAVEVHQSGTNSSDFVMGMKLSVVETIPGTGNLAYENALKLVSSLRITEIMYNPDNGSNFEFVEFQNIGTETIDLTGVHFTDGIDFIFPAMTLAPGEFAVIVNDIASFQAKYGTGITIAGEFLGNLSNGGETLTVKLPEPYDAAILRFDYDDIWYPQTDGPGYSLEIVNSAAATNTWGTSTSWQSGALQGTPGGFDSVNGGLAQTIVLPAAVPLDGQIVGTWTPSILWEKISGPGSVVFTDPNAIDTSATITEPGTYVLRVTATGTSLTVLNNVTVVIDDLYEQWRIRKSAGNPLDDDDGDGFTNLVEYAFDTNPLDPYDGTAMDPVATVVSGVGGTAFELTYTHFLRKSDIIYAAQYGTELVNWTPVADSPISADTDWEVRKVSLPVSGALRQFVRIAVTK